MERCFGVGGQLASFGAHIFVEPPFWVLCACSARERSSRRALPTSSWRWCLWQAECGRRSLSLFSTPPPSRRSACSMSRPGHYGGPPARSRSQGLSRSAVAESSNYAAAAQELASVVNNPAAQSSWLAWPFSAGAVDFEAAPPPLPPGTLPEVSRLGGCRTRSGG